MYLFNHKTTINKATFHTELSKKIRKSAKIYRFNKKKIEKVQKHLNDIRK